MRRRLWCLAGAGVLAATLGACGSTSTVAPSSPSPVAATGVLTGNLGTSGPMATVNSWMPLRGRVTAVDQDGRVHSVLVGASGRFTMRLPVGTYVVSASSPEYQVHEGNNPRNVGRCNAPTPDVAVSAGSFQTVLLQCIEI